MVHTRRSALKRQIEEEPKKNKSFNPVVLEIPKEKVHLKLENLHKKSKSVHHSVSESEYSESSDKSISRYPKRTRNFTTTMKFHLFKSKNKEFVKNTELKQSA